MALYDKNGNPTGGTGGTSANKLKGKTVVFIGDSLHAYEQWDGVTIPYLFGHNTGAKVYNWCQGGMTMALMDIPAYDAYSCVGMVNAIVDKNFTNQIAYKSDDHGTAQGNFNQQVGEMQSLDFNTVDCVVIEYGTNDGFKQVPLDNESNKFDNYSTCGALRYAIRKLLTSYHKLRIFVVTPHQQTGYSDAEHQKPYDLKNQRDKIADVAKELNVSCCDVYHDLGLNEWTVSTLCVDGTHYTHEGKVRQARLIENVMSGFF